MARGVAAVPKRPEGTDGSDYGSRMTVDNRYKTAAMARVRLRKLIVAQTSYIFTRCLWPALLAWKGEEVPVWTLTAVCTGAAATLIGTLAVNKNEVGMWTMYFATSLGTAGLLLASYATTGWLDQFMDYGAEMQDGGEWHPFARLCVEGLQDVFGCLIFILSAVDSGTFLSRMTAKKAPDDKDK